jgi:hypothetical protein
MTTLKKLAEQAQKLVTAGRLVTDRNISTQEMVLFVTQAFGHCVRMNFFEGKAEGESYVDGSFIYTFDDVAVEKDTRRDLYYSVMPSSTITLPNEMGIFHVSLVQDQSNPFVRLPNGYMGLMEALDVAGMENRKMFFQDGTRIYYTNITGADGITSVLLKLVVSLDGIDDEEEINVPNDIQLKILNIAVEAYKTQMLKPTDKSPDLVQQ